MRRRSGTTPSFCGGFRRFIRLGAVTLCGACVPPSGTPTVLPLHVDGEPAAPELEVVAVPCGGSSELLVAKYELTNAIADFALPGISHRFSRCVQDVYEVGLYLPSVAIASSPVSCISMAEAAHIAEILSDSRVAALLERERVYGRYRLPTIDEWKCYAGIQEQSPFAQPGKTQEEECAMANLGDDSLRKALRELGTSFPGLQQCDDGYPLTAPVGSFPANKFGIHDIDGNVREWLDGGWAGRAYPDMKGFTAWQVGPVDWGAEVDMANGVRYVFDPARGVGETEE